MGGGITRSRNATGGTRYSSASRCLWLLALMAFALAVVVCRLVWIQGVEGPALALKAEKQRMRDMTLSARRGSIYDRDGQPLAVTIAAKTIYAVPAQVLDATATARTIARTVGGSASAYLTKLHKHSAFVYVVRKADVTRATALQNLRIVGIGFLDDSRRVYPLGDLACQVLGFVGIDDSGLAGVERQYDSVLAGVPGRVVAERDPMGQIIPGGIVTAQDPVDGQAVHLTIDNDIQYQAQLDLAAAVRQFGAAGGSVVVMDPRDGAILAIASTPYFDPNRFARAKQDAMRNKSIADAYEPGSTLKAMTAAAAIDQSLYTPSSMFLLPPTLQVGNRVIHDAETRGTVTWSLTKIVTQSSNVGAVKIGQGLGRRRLLAAFKRFGLGSRTGVDFPGESAGALPATSTWSLSTMGNIPFGQGLSVTPLQLGRALSAIANGGTLVTPHLVSAVGSVPTTFAASPERVISQRTAQATTVMLTDVVRDGTGIGAAVPGYEVAGKTGTAQVPAPGGRGYLKNVYVSSFAGFLPASDPRVLIVVTVDEPKTGMYGGTVAAPAFSALARFCVEHLRVPPAPRIKMPSGLKAVRTVGRGND